MTWAFFLGAEASPATSTACDRPGEVTWGFASPSPVDVYRLFGAFYEELFFVVRRWAALVEAEIDAWPATSGVGWTPTTRAVAERAVKRCEPTGP